jgi:hypothetical protein
VVVQLGLLPRAALVAVVALGLAQLARLGLRGKVTLEGTLPAQVVIILPVAAGALVLPEHHQPQLHLPVVMEAQELPLRLRAQIFNMVVVAAALLLVLEVLEVAVAQVMEQTMMSVPIQFFGQLPDWLTLAAAVEAAV